MDWYARLSSLESRGAVPHGARSGIPPANSLREAEGRHPASDMLRSEEWAVVGGAVVFSAS